MKPLASSGPRVSRRSPLLALTAGVLFCMPSASWAQATELFFSEYVEGSGFNKALEIYNGTGAAIDLGAGDYRVEIYFNGSSSAGQTILLAGVLADGDVFVVAIPNADPAILAQTDLSDGGVLFNGNDAVVLKRGAVVLDAFGQVGFDPGAQWGSGDTGTQDGTLRRKSEICAGDDDATDPFDPSSEWDGFARDTFDGLGSHTASCNTVSLEDLLERIEMLEARVEDLEGDLDGHTHGYLTGKGEGHNNTPATTGEAALPE
jgi:predicted extracellular nuclease